MVFPVRTNLAGGEAGGDFVSPLLPCHNKKTEHKHASAVKKKTRKEGKKQQEREEFFSVINGWDVLQGDWQIF